MQSRDAPDRRALECGDSGCAAISSPTPRSRVAAPSRGAAGAAAPRSRAAAPSAGTPRSMTPRSAASPPSRGTSRTIIPRGGATPRAISIAGVSTPGRTVISSMIKAGSTPGGHPIGCPVGHPVRHWRGGDCVDSGAAGLENRECGGEGRHCDERECVFHRNSPGVQVNDRPISARKETGFREHRPVYGRQNRRHSATDEGSNLRTRPARAGSSSDR